ncbi:MAG: MogA/MoaB family molybdenum cofactor biosynthesis protein [Candidatus Omnitrophica bacterium]|nr:MogA/MoaB family molybdenum cofactor biosynthesis protein [Candidatus Omnitrophota bacterium]MBI2496110.1 MogA/MoaB family molybdenum cofactor biosynthesis protein [Candidatus Omnitrophota bacterium]MBI3021342.1 MogA/MoaB family molybdenum cofactor biosynthesis protein [Candidatus Omnitrophota bacterium]MBI3083886.1 MogA/MoaB family molybdenum cofactor biosynthesis protein [Candidatus Omnitrophota bacterium]
MAWHVGILTISDTRSQGVRADTATPLLRRFVEEAGFVVESTTLVPDDQAAIQERLIDMADRFKVPLILTTGGTGFGERDVTPEATQAVIDREVPGLPQAMRGATAEENPLAWLSRGIAGLRGRTLIVNLPGSPRAVEECLRVLLPLLPHAMEMVDGASHR